MNRPVIAVTSDVKFIDPYRWHAVPSPYIDALVVAAKALPLVLPSVGDAIAPDDLFDRIDGVLVTGSRSNVHPEHYGADPTAQHEPFDADRDATTLPLIRAAIERGVPLLAICRGIQEMNVALGGTLTADFQKVRDLEDHGYPWVGTLDERFALAHEIDVEPGSHLAGILDGEPASGPVRVNSLHTQALDRIGDGLVVEARAKDGTVEAVRATGTTGFAIGVQWHPEYWASSDSVSNRIFTAFGDAARTFATARTTDRSVATIAAE